MTLEPGSTLGRYQVLSPLGHGGMASVYKAFQPALERTVALKVLRPAYAHDPEFLERFRREARAIARLRHPHIVQVHDFEESDGQVYLVMEHIEGGTLKQRLSQLARAGQRLPAAETARIVREVAEGLGHAHAQGIVHRDVKPSNVMLTRDGRAIVTDFGIAKILAAAGATQTGIGVGTPEYMSPEQGQASSSVDHRSDIYSLGVLAYELLTGRVPFAADTPLAVMLAHVRDPLPLPSRVEPRIGPRTEQVLLRALAKDASARYDQATELAGALEAALASEAGRADPTPTLAPTVARAPALLRLRGFAPPGITLPMPPSSYLAALAGGVLVIALLGGGAAVLGVFGEGGGPTLPGSSPGPLPTAAQATAADSAQPGSVAGPPSSPSVPQTTAAGASTAGPTATLPSGPTAGTPPPPRSAAPGGTAPGPTATLPPTPAPTPTPTRHPPLTIAPGTATYPVSGRVVSGVTGAPLRDVVVFPRYASGSCCIATTRTDANGNYSIALPNATYRMQFIPDAPSGHSPRYWPEGISVEDGRNLIVSGAPVGGIDMTLLTGFLVSGRVTREADGAAVAQAPVIIRLKTGSMVVERSSSVDGSWSVRLPVGTYEVTFYQPHPSGGCCDQQPQGTSIEVTVAGDVRVDGRVP